MELADVRILASELLTQHQLCDWQFRLDHARTRCGSCHFHNKRISLSLKAMQEMAPARSHTPAGGGGGGGNAKGGTSKGRSSGRKGKEVDPSKFLRDEDAHLKKLKASLASKFGDNLKGGLG